jgi:histidinol dehydrogenase
MKRVSWFRLATEERKAALQRPSSRSDPKLLASVRGIVEDVKERGWPAVEHYSRWIDAAEPQLIKVASHADEARRRLAPGLVEALGLAFANIERFHAATLPEDVTVETFPGVMVSKAWRPLGHAGIYVPGGSAPLFSTLLMLAVPARVAGVLKLSLVTPPRPQGLDPAIALAADLCGIEEIWSIGGAHAIAALAFGAGEIAPVDLVCGPGNAWVAAAKSLVSAMPGGPRIDLPAGPSELMVIADEDADPRLVAADLMSQAEHDRSAQVILVATSQRIAEAAEAELERRLPLLPRSEIAAAALDHSLLILVDDLGEAIDIANAYAPEHLSLSVEAPGELVPQIRNAGAIFAAAGAAETFGDYLAGSSHVLPTDGAARSWGGVSTQTFMKAITVQEVSREAAIKLAEAAAALARAEGLEAHARAAEARLEAPA